MDGDFSLNVRQVAQYPFAAAAAATDAVLLQQGGIGGAYAYTSPAGLVTPSIAAQITTATLNLTGVGPIYWNQGQFLQANASGFSFNWPGTPGLLLSILPTGDATLTGMLSVGRDPLTPFEVSTKNYTDNTVATAKQLLTDNSVWTVNGKSGNVNLTWADLIGMGGAPIFSPAFQGVPTVPSITNDNQHDWQIANTAFVQDVVNCKINALLHAQPFVWSFNGRIGNVWLTVDDVNAALAVPGAIAYATTPPLGDASGRIATTLFVDNSIEDLRSWVDQQNFAFDQQLSLYAPLASPQFSGIPTAPTAPPATSTGQLATTAYVMAAVQASTSGVVSFNGRTGIVDLLDTDITNAGGALLVSPVFTGTPQAPTATAGTDTAQLATCAFVLNELGGASIGVMSFNGRGGAVVLTAADLTGAGGALLAGPAFTGVPTAPTAATGVATQQLATTAFVAAAIAALSIGVSSFNSRTGAVTLTTNDISAAGGAVLASPIFSGQPTAPTASPGTSTTQLATTAFVMAALAAANVVSSFNGRSGAVTLTTADVSAAGGPYLPLAGGTMTGLLTLTPATGAQTQISNTSGPNRGLISTGSIYLGQAWSGGFVGGIAYSGGWHQMGFNWPSNYLTFYIDGTLGGIIPYSTSGYTALSNWGLSGSSYIAAFDTTGAGWTWNVNASDRRLKNKIKPATVDALGLINSLKVYSALLTMPLPEAVAEHWDCTLMADEVEPLIPRAYMAPLNDKSYASLNPLPLVTTLIRAVQQLTARVARLEDPQAKSRIKE
jgi:hypothetical protein